jgi:tetratricopeptide (TPR) repeat protein
MLTGESKRMVRAFEQGVADLGDTIPASHAWLGNAYAQTGRTDEALASLDRAFLMSPQDRERTDWYLNRGTAYEAAGRFEEARDAVLAGLELGMNSTYNVRASLYRSLAAYQAILGEHAAAAEAWHDYLKLGGPSDWATIARPMSNFSEERRNRYRDALRIAGLED